MTLKLVISGFPGVGKTYLYNNLKEKGIKVSDSDSSLYKGQFPLEYLDHIEELVHNSDNDVILVSSHEEVRKGMRDRGIKYILVYPDIYAKDEFITRYIRRGSSVAFIDLLSDNWELWIKAIEKSNELKFKLKENDFGNIMSISSCYNEIVNKFLNAYDNLDYESDIDSNIREYNKYLTNLQEHIDSIKEILREMEKLNDGK